MTCDQFKLTENHLISIKWIKVLYSYCHDRKTIGMCLTVHKSMSRISWSFHSHNAAGLASQKVWRIHISAQLQYQWYQTISVIDIVNQNWNYLKCQTDTLEPVPCFTLLVIEPGIHPSSSTEFLRRQCSSETQDINLIPQRQPHMNNAAISLKSHTLLWQVRMGHGKDKICYGWQKRQVNCILVCIFQSYSNWLCIQILKWDE